ncbi:fluoride efflux transporter FluC [Kingella kingae]|uniref:fluoride efflux transporter FluC n=1 Tax=Kingella kingae TaxID=504 RepID=UPI0003FC840A|nr:CrcB family protein [Kingella kingae]MDK4529778.1 CrcB family protein [Kingella kingae]MDK4580396.1 CrcB family protein [Kingella kingae]
MTQMNMVQAACVAIGAILGAWSRWGLGVWLNSSLHFMAWGTWLANTLGCLLIGMAWGASWGTTWQLLVVTGFLGSFTTFSALANEVITLAYQGRWGSAMWVWLLHNASGLGAVALGAGLVRWIVGKS